MPARTAHRIERRECELDVFHFFGLQEREEARFGGGAEERDGRGGGRADFVARGLEERERVLERPEVIHAIGEHTAAMARERIT